MARSCKRASAAVLLSLASLLCPPTAKAAASDAPAIIDASSGDAYRADVKLDKSGNAVAVFEQDTGGTYRLYANSYTAARGWGGPVIIDAGGGNAYRGKLALDGKTGDAMAVFKQETGKGSGIYASVYRDGLWEAPARIDPGSGNADGAATAFGPAGNAAAVFEEHDGKAYRIYVNMYDPEKGWLRAVMVSRASDKDALFPALAFDLMGNLHVAYYELDEKGLALFAASRNAGSGKWGEPVRISSTEGTEPWKGKKSRTYRDKAGAPLLLDEIRKYAYSGAYAYAELNPSEADSRYRDAFTPSMVATTTQGIALFFAQFRDGNLRGFASYHNPEKGWTPPELMDASGNDIEHLRASVGPFGEIALVFSQWKGEGSRVYARIYSPFSGWGNAEAVDASHGYGPSAAFADNGGITAVWCGRRDMSATAFANARAGNRWGKAQRLEQADGLTCGVSIGSSPDGKAVIIYEQQTALPDGRLVNRLYAVQYGE